MRALKIPDLESYVALLGTGGQNDELRMLVDLVSVRETRFFRGKGPFDALRSEIVPEVLERIKLSGNTGRHLHAWSAGCSTGEEAYSIAITLLEATRESYPVPVRVVGTDISMTALSTAARGVYHQDALGELDADLLRRYFTRVSPGRGTRADEAYFKVGEALASCVRFYEHNLAAFPYPRHLDGFDIILCRNVLIYFSESLAERVIQELASRLNQGGYLIVDPRTDRTGIDRTKFLLIQNPYGTVVKRRTPIKTLAGRIDARPLLLGSSAGETPVNASTDLAIAHSVPQVLGSGGPSLVDEMSLAEDSDERLSLAAGYADNGDLSQALSLLSAMALENSLDPRVYLLMGEIYVQMGDLRSALQSFSRATYLEPNNAIAHWRMACVYRQMGKYGNELHQLYNVLDCLEDSNQRSSLEIAEGMLLRACISRIEAIRKSQHYTRGSSARP